MNSLFEIVEKWNWHILNFACVAIMVSSLVILLEEKRSRIRKKVTILASFCLILTSMVFLVLMACSGKILEGAPDRYSFEFEEILFDLPWILYLLIEAGLLILCLFTISIFISSKRRTLTPDAIRQTVDIHPDGIAICEANGTILLSNLKIVELCRMLTGHLFVNGNTFWETIEKKERLHSDMYLIHTDDQEVWLFEKTELETKEKRFRIRATRVSERYKIIEELEEKHDRLQDIQRRMKTVTKLSGDMFIAQEEAEAKAALHNQLGQVLLMGRHYLSHTDTIDARMVYTATRQMNRFLLGEVEEPYTGEEDLSSAIAMAGSIGVLVEISGEEPHDPKSRKILSSAITECAANTVKHAEGDKIFVTIKENEGERIFCIRNNGKPPKERITESGGLLSLRKNIESSGGEMELQSVPEFLLRIKIRAEKE
ncbi:MAG: hypothetical protein IKZ90_07465 [Clostridiales bacterium]|nr:hypothetical protein [Clostridiales bacterium]